MFAIKAKKREEGIKLDFLRKSGEIPAVFYGAGKDTTSISVPIVEFKKVWRDAGESSAIKVEILDKNIDVLIHEVQVDPVNGEPIHADFLAIDMKKKIRVNVPLKFEGISEAVKSGIGNLVKVMHEFEIEALPSDLPHDLVVDISKLKTLNDQVFVSDVKLPAGVVAINEPTEVVASIVEQVEEKEEAAAPVDLSAIEVEKKGKKDLPSSEDSEGESEKKD
ncbi:MAG: 50S ribosomal protein L25 [Candidatus Pacebacteria bacterium]|nr:50S ribosomal protein L25 [Candidatus Paceibacterota bacterium]